MKAKLLKKVRQRFEIIHMPKGYVSFDGEHCGEHYNYNLFKLIDHKKGDLFDVYAQLGERADGRRYVNKILNIECYVSKIFNTEIECIDYLKSRIIERLRVEGYSQRKDKTIQLAQKKVWHN